MSPTTKRSLAEAALAEQLARARAYLHAAKAAADSEPPTAKTIFLAQLNISLAEIALSRAKLAEATIRGAEGGASS